MGVESFYDLEVYQKAFHTSVDIHKETLNFPKIEQFALSSQIRRASKSIPANIAEGFAKQFESNLEYMRFLMIALGSANEMLVWLDYASELNYIEEIKVAEYKAEYVSICKMLKALHRSRKTLS